VQSSRAFSFDGDGEAFRIASEAQRIRLAHLFDPYLAVHSSRLEPLPHQIMAIYGEMLPCQPLRFLLADDPGAGASRSNFAFSGTTCAIAARVPTTLTRETTAGRAANGRRLRT